MGEINAFVDESGIIKKGDLTSPDFFVIGMAFTDNEKHIKKVFTKKRLKQLTESEIEELKETRSEERRVGKECRY